SATPGPTAHHVMRVDSDDRVRALADLSGVSERTVMFTRTKHGAKRLAKQLNGRGVASVDLHGNLSQNARVRNLDAFSSGEATVMVATDIAARGIHVDAVGLVVHADPPAEHTAYVHRSVRTARAGAVGTVVTVATRDQVQEVRSLLRKAGVTAGEIALSAGADAAAALSDAPEPPPHVPGGAATDTPSGVPAGGAGQRPGSGRSRRRRGGQGRGRPGPERTGSRTEPAGPRPAGPRPAGPRPAGPRTAGRPSGSEQRRLPACRPRSAGFRLGPEAVNRPERRAAPRRSASSLDPRRR